MEIENHTMDTIVTLIVGVLIGIGAGIAVEGTVAHVDKNTTFACHANPKGDEGFTIEVDGITYQCERTGL